MNSIPSAISSASSRRCCALKGSSISVCMRWLLCDPSSVLLAWKVNLDRYRCEDVMESVLGELISMLAVVSVFIAICSPEGAS